MTTSVTRPCFTTHQTCKTKTDFLWSQTGLVLRPTVSDHITDMGYAGFTMQKSQGLQKKTVFCLQCFDNVSSGVRKGTHPVKVTLIDTTQ